MKYSQACTLLGLPIDTACTPEGKRSVIIEAKRKHSAENYTPTTQQYYNLKKGAAFMTRLTVKTNQAPTTDTPEKIIAAVKDFAKLQYATSYGWQCILECTDTSEYLEEIAEYGLTSIKQAIKHYQEFATLKDSQYSDIVTEDVISERDYSSFSL
jgi:hypothetical protein